MPRGRKRNPDSPFASGPLATEAPVDGPPKPARPLWLVSVFSNPHEWKERLLKIHHPLRLLFPVKLSAFSLSFLFGMKCSGLFWQPEGATEHGFLRPRASLLSKLTAASQGARGVGLAVLGEGSRGDPLSAAGSVTINREKTPSAGLGSPGAQG